MLKSAIDEKREDDIAETIARVIILFDNVIHVHGCGVVDVLGGLNVSDCDQIYRTQCLANTLNVLNLPDDISIVIENQPDIMQSNVIQAQLMMYFSVTKPTSNIYLIEPTAKNAINFDNSIHMKVFMQHGRDKYHANKMHSAANFLHFVRVFGLQKMLVVVDHKYDDLADSFLQLLVYASTYWSKNL